MGTPRKDADNETEKEELCRISTEGRKQHREKAKTESN